MKTLKELREILVNSGIKFLHNNDFWLKEESILNEEELQKLEKLVNWICELPNRIEKETSIKLDIELSSSYYSDIFGIEKYTVKGYDNKKCMWVFKIGGIINDLNVTKSYIEYNDICRKWLQTIDFDNLDRYINIYFRPIIITTNTKGDHLVSHKYSAYGINELVNYLSNKSNNIYNNKWIFLSDDNTYKLFKEYHPSDMCHYVFWSQDGTGDLLTLEYNVDSKNVIGDYCWTNDTFIVRKEDNGESWIYKYDYDVDDYIKLVKIDLK